jgi:site-specific DNA-methyltransferase (adenine-specific)
MGNKWDHDRGGFDEGAQWLTDRLAPSVKALRPGGYAVVWALPKTSHWTARALELAGLEVRDIHHHFYSASEDVRNFLDLLTPEQKSKLDSIVEGQSSPLLYHLFGQGKPASKYALKPAVEHWILAWKPPSLPIKDNIDNYGTGGLNIESCRVEGIPESPGTTPPTSKGTGRTHGKIIRAPYIVPDGRWPAHVSFDEETATVLDAQTGDRSSGGRKGQAGQKMGYGGGASGYEAKIVDPSKGGPSRFFYVSKAPKSERNLGLPDGQINMHPCVKRIELMEWLIRLVTPVGGSVLDPFAGSGSTGVAALRQGYKFVGIEQGGCNDEYISVLLSRIQEALDI